MAWASLLSGTQLALDGDYETVQKDAADWEVTLNPGEMAQVVLDANPQGTPTENIDVIVCRTADGTLYESDGEAERHIIEHTNRESDDPAILSIVVVGCYGFKVRARVRDTDDTAGGDDTGSTLDVDVRLDGVDV